MSNVFDDIESLEGEELVFSNCEVISSKAKRETQKPFPFAGRLRLIDHDELAEFNGEGAHYFKPQECHISEVLENIVTYNGCESADGNCNNCNGCCDKLQEAAREAANLLVDFDDFINQARALDKLQAKQPTRLAVAEAIRKTVANKRSKPMRHFDLFDCIIGSVLIIGTLAAVITYFAC